MKDSYVDVGFGKADVSRERRTGYGEVIYGEGKTSEEIHSIAKVLWESGQKNILVTRMSADKAVYFKNIKGPWQDLYTYFQKGSCLVIGRMEDPQYEDYILVVSAGTSDIPVCEEVVTTCKFYGANVKCLFDVGVAGIHRLLDNIELVNNARVIVACAGMEGALASVVGGLAKCPVIALPTSVGYGTAFGGITALFSMLNSCSSGLSVVNIDNGFGAGYMANMIYNMGEKK